MTLQAAVVGLGVGEQHARAFARTPGVALRYVCDHNRPRMEALAEELGCQTASFDAILGDPSTDIVALATYDDEHAAQVVRALDAGRHVFCEKPLCHTQEELAAIKASWLRSRRRLACNLVLRAAPFYSWLRAAIRAGELGEIYAFDGDYLYGRIHKITGGWRGDVEDYSVTQGGGVHLVDLMLWLTGQRPARVSMTGNRIATAGTKFRYDDFAAATFDFESGLVGRITSNFGCVHRHQHVVRVFGTKATVLYDDRGPRIHRDRDADGVALDLAPLPSSKGDLIPGFVDEVRSRAQNTDSTQHEFDVIAACIGADRARKTGAPIPIEYP